MVQRLAAKDRNSQALYTSNLTTIVESDKYMITRRREFILRAVCAYGSLSFVTPSWAQTCLLGTWYVKCPFDGQIDVVEEGTRQHLCSRDHKQVFHDGGVTVVCPNGHENFVKSDGCITSFKCKVDGLECNRTAVAPQKPDKGARI